jgi:heptosyltransferase-3
MSEIKKILILVQRSNGDVFLSSPLIKALHNHYQNCIIDLLINKETLGIAKTLQHINHIHIFSKEKKKHNRLAQEREIIKSIYKKYDLSINLIARDRSVLYSILAGNQSISAIEQNQKKSWWKKLLLTDSYIFDSNNHVVVNNCKSLELLGIDNSKISLDIKLDSEVLEQTINKIKDNNIKPFFIFHTSAQYEYKVYPTHLRNKLIQLCSDNDISLIITGGNTPLDDKISRQIPNLPNIYNYIGKTSLKELYCLIHLSLGYIGMDTLVMHMSAALNKDIFAIFGPSNPTMWGPWKNHDNQIIKVIQANMDCVPCGKAGCDNQHGKSDCLYNISPKDIFRELKSKLDQESSNE